MTVRFTPGRARWLLWVAAPFGATLILAIVLYILPAAPSFRLTALDPPRETLNFTLLDQLGGRVSLADFRGQAELEPVWEYYWVGKVWTDERGNVMHQAPVHLIDPQGQVRAASGQAFRPAELAHDIDVLLKG